MKYALFDVCGTLIPYASTNEFIRYVTLKDRFSTAFFLIATFSGKFNIVRGKGHKSLMLRFLKSRKRSDLERLAAAFASTRLLPDTRTALMKEWNFRKSQGYRCGLVSGGLDLVLKPYAKLLQAEFVLSSKLLFKNDRCEGALEGPDNVGEEKIRSIESLRPRINRDLSVAYGDSRSDIPILTAVHQGIAVTNEAWPSQLGLKMLCPDSR